MACLGAPGRSSSRCPGRPERGATMPSTVTMNEMPSRTRDVERDLRLAQAEIRQLHETIGVLREELELQAEGTQQKVQHAVAVAGSENLHLRGTVSEVRLALEAKLA